MTKQSKSWRDVIEVHPAANLFPMMEADELKALGEDIRQHGLREPIAIDCKKPGDGPYRYSLIEGRNRLDAMEMAGLAPQLQLQGGSPKLTLDSWKLTLAGCDKVDVAQPVLLLVQNPIAYVLSKNLHRRHLTPEQKRELIAKLVKATPEKSDRQIAELTKASPSTVGKVRNELEETGDVSKLDTRADAKGRKQQAHRPRNKNPAVLVAADRSEVRAEQKPEPAPVLQTHAPSTPQLDDPNYPIALMANLTAEVRSTVDLVEANWPDMLKPMCNEIIGVFRTVIERRGQGRRPIEMPDIPDFLRRSATT
jgi:hypothetical protein